ncbi:MAG: hypothetical protein IT515_18205 [Burkholderiales bacterium]|nr:hypothetical protein [Burkholderiales bacterium]
MRRARFALLLPLALAAACSMMPDYDNVEIIPRFEVRPNATPECVAAARRASFWCGRPIPVSDQFYSGRCLNAGWDYQRACN